MMEVETDLRRLRVLWIGSLAMLRMVGHVLDKVDGKDPAVRAAINSRWPTLKREPIFEHFINSRRDLALKEGEIDLFDQSSINVMMESPAGSKRLATIEDCLFMPLQHGFRAGEDGRDVFRDALDWWDAVLEELEGE